MSLAYLNGRYVPLREATLPVWDRGLVQGATITERFRTFRHELFLVEPHLDRLQRSMEATGIRAKESRAELTEILRRVTEQGARSLDPRLDIGVVLFITAGPTPADAALYGVEFRTTTCVHPVSLPFHRWTRGYREGERLVIPPIRSMPAEVLSPQVKYRSRLHWFLADQSAHAQDPAASALLIDADGRLTETSAANLFLVRGNELSTPTADITLPGISQQYLISLAKDLGLSVRAADLRTGDLWQADEALASSTSSCLMPVVSVDGRPIGSGTPGPVFRRLIAEWSRRVGVDIVTQAEHAPSRNSSATHDGGR